jgi:hypothetical protein
MHGITRKFLVAGAVALAGAMAAQTAHAAADMKVKVYGQIDRGLLMVDDGDESKLYFVDNKNSSTRFGIDAKATIEGGMTVGGKFEAELQSNSSTDVNQLEEKTDAVLKERHMDVWLEGGFGKVSIGQGNTASNETSEVDLSGTTVIAYSDVKQFSGGILFFDEAAGELSGVKIKDVFNNLDGLSRDDRIRYDTPYFAGFTASASLGSKEFWDAALRYNGTFGETKFAAAVAYAEFGDLDKTVEGEINGSASVLLPFGLSLTGAAGQKQLDEKLAGRSDDPMFWYGKVAYTAKLAFAGSTTFGADYSVSDDMKKDGDEATTYAAFVVQRLDNYNTELYLAYRLHELDRVGVDYADVSGLMGGARIKF